MIPLEKQVISLEISQKLKLLGVPQGESCFVWFKFPEKIEISGGVRKVISYRETVIPRDNIKLLPPESEDGILCDAFTPTEIFKLFPINGITPKLEFLGERYLADYNEGNEFYFEEYDENPADALAKILLRIICSKDFEEYMKVKINPQDLKL